MVYRINENADLYIQTNKNYIEGYLIYKDGCIISMGKLKNNNGNFLYDSNYIYRWSYDKYLPFVFDVNNRVEINSKEKINELVLNYKKHL